MAEERTPAGWYPDPSGLPQLRWWDNHKWTEFVSDSQLEPDSQESEYSQEPERRGAHAASHSAEASAAQHSASGFAAEHSAAAYIAAQTESARPEPIVAEPAARYDAGPRVDPSTAPDLRSAFDAMFTAPAQAAPQQAASAQAEPAQAAPRQAAPRQAAPTPTPEPSLVDAFDRTFGYATPGVPDPAEALFAASATSPIGVGTGETIGEALMRALQSA